MPAWKITALSNKSAEILLYDEIGDFFGVEAKGFIEELNALGDVDSIDLRINSPGGSIFQGIPIFNALKRHSATVNVFIDGIALSMASGIAMAGDNVEMCDNGLMMIHNPQSVAAGDAAEMERTAEMLTKARDQLAKAYAGKTGKSMEEISDLMAAETWMTAEEAFEAGFIDAINECDQKMAASYDADSVNVPSRLQGVFNSLTQEAIEMADKTNAGATSKATLQELELLNNDNTFIVNCLKAEMSLDQARDELIQTLKADNQRLEGIVADQKQQIDNGIKEDTLRHQAGAQIPEPGQAQREANQPAAQPKAEPKPEPKPEPSPVVETSNKVVGNQPIAVGTSTPQAVEDFGGDPVAFMKKAKAEVRAEMMASTGKADPVAILREVNNRYPDLPAALHAYGEQKKAS